MHLLLVDDNPADALLVRTGLEIIDSPHELHVVEDGTEAILFLQRQDSYTGAPRPKIIIIDLNMPRMDGRELLRWIRSEATVSSIPVVVLTTTDSAKDIELCYRLGANSFVTKPNDVEDFFDLIRSIETFWLRFSASPTRD